VAESTRVCSESSLSELDGGFSVEDNEGLRAFVGEGACDAGVEDRDDATLVRVDCTALANSRTIRFVPGTLRLEPATIRRSGWAEARARGAGVLVTGGFKGGAAVSGGDDEGGAEDGDDKTSPKPMRSLRTLHRGEISITETVIAISGSVTEDVPFTNPFTSEVFLAIEDNGGTHTSHTPIAFAFHTTHRAIRCALRTRNAVTPSKRLELVLQRDRMSTAWTDKSFKGTV